MGETNYILTPTGQFKTDFKRYRNDKNKVSKITKTLKLLEKGGAGNLPKSMKTHFLTGNYKRHLECHIEPDLLMIWLQYDESEKEIILVRLGSHSELF